MVPFSSFLRIEKVYGPEQVTRYNMYTSAMVNGQPASGYSSGQAHCGDQGSGGAKIAERFWLRLGWFVRATKPMPATKPFISLLICLLFVYLLLAAQYESFLLPMAVILSLPIGVFGALFFLMIMGLENNIYAQIAMIMLIGILGKNAILIIEFATMKTPAREKRRLKRQLKARRLRLRPILMTSFAFIAGLIPLMFASGAGKIGNNTIGSAAAGGMIFGTIFGVIVIPGLYVVFATIAEKHQSWRKKRRSRIH